MVTMSDDDTCADEDKPGRPLAVVRNWVNDHCTDPSQIFDRKQAKGILGLHKTCTPPCPRKLAAEREVARPLGSWEKADGR
jgi:hypothetical protein